MTGTRRYSRLANVACVLCGIMGLSGCTRSGPLVAPVRGTVTYNGAPLESGSVIFIPESGGKFASGEIHADGRFRLTTFRANDGALVGSHRIMVSAVHFPGGEESPAVPLIPFRYSSDQTSGLSAVVADGQENVVDLTLTSKPAAKRH